MMRQPTQAEILVEHQIYFYSSDHCIPPPPHKTASRLKEHAEDGGDKEKYDVLFKQFDISGIKIVEKLMRYCLANFKISQKN